jgi:hypothetical protein
VSESERYGFAIALAIGLWWSGCSSCASYRRCNPPPPALVAQLPARLSETGLFADTTGEALAVGVRAYEPAYALWSDGATKRRWIALPEGARIDTSDPDDWSFPAGTKLWKEFSRGDVRIETRLLMKVGPGIGDWAGAAYLWDPDQRDARLASEGRQNADGHGYEVPRASDCGGCHGGRRSYVLGFSAVQLAKPGLPLTLDELLEEGRLSVPLPAEPHIPGNDTERSALGYLHANCGHCHNRERPPRGAGPRCYDPERSLDFWLPSNPPENARELPAVSSSVPRFVTPGDPDDSRLIALVSRRGSLLHMPPLASHRVDPDGVRQLRSWIDSLGEHSP